MKAVVISFDHLHLGFLGCYGSPWIETPHWNRLAAEGAVFDHHFGENFDPEARNHAWWTGCYQFPATHEEQEHLDHSLIEKLRHAGILTRALVQSDAQVPGIGRHFEQSLRMAEMVAIEDRAPELSSDTWEKAALEQIACLASTPHKSDLLWLHAAGVSASHLPLGSDENTFRQEDAQSVTALDAQLGRLREALGPLLATGDCLLVVTACAGAQRRPSAEVAEEDHASTWLAEELVHAPLIIVLPSNEDSLGRFAPLVQTVDLVPTLLDWFRVPLPPASCDGVSLLPVVRGERKTVRDSALLGWGREFWGIRTEEFFSRMESPDAGPRAADNTQLFRKPEDRWDVDDVARQFPETVAEFERRMSDFAQQHRRKVQAALIQTV